MKQEIVKKTSVHLLKSPLIMPFTIASGSHRELENLMFRLELAGGETGWGEAPIASHITGEDIASTSRNLKYFGERIRGRNISNYLALLVEAEEFFEKNRAGLFAVQTAVMDAFCRIMKIPLWKMYGRKPARAQTDITVVIGDEKDAFDFSLKMRKRGFKIFKIKVGKNQDEDIKRVSAVKKAVKDCQIYLDANCAYGAREAFAFIRELGKRGVIPAVVEQPVKKDDYEGLAFLSRALKMPVLADESAYSLDDVSRMIRTNGVSGINIKLTKFGLLRSAEIRRLALAKGLKLMIGQMMESQLATFAALHFSLGSGGFDFLDLDTPYFLSGGVMSYERAAMSSGGFYDIAKIKIGVGAVPRAEFCLKKF